VRASVAATDGSQFQQSVNAAMTMPKKHFSSLVFLFVGIVFGEIDR